ncbi:hypothetical protein AHAS_Ahas14G0042600 [Arachis hypogaea]
MDESLKRFLFVAVTKGHHPGVFTSWEEANEQATNFTFSEFECFNSYEHASMCFKSRMSSISLASVTGHVQWTSSKLYNRAQPYVPDKAAMIVGTRGKKSIDLGVIRSATALASLACPWIQQQFERLTYSEISGSTLIFNSPKHFVAYYALPRL